MMHPETRIYPHPQMLISREGVSDISGNLADRIASYLFQEDAPEGIDAEVDASVLSQGYRLHITEGHIGLSYSDAYGLLYGMRSLSQLVFSYGKSLPCLDIEDHPDIPVRGYMLDISRDKIPRLETLYSLVDALSLLKYNQLQLYMELAFAYKGYEDIWRNSDPLSGEDIESLEEYCRRRGIELVPNQNCFGHMERWLDHPSMAHLAEVKKGFVDTLGNYRNHRFSLNPTHPGSLAFVRGLMDQLLPYFRSDLVNIDCDETFDLGQGENRQLCREQGAGRLYVDFLNKIFSLIHEKNKTPLFWGDIIKNYPELIDELPENIIALDWGYEEDYDFAGETTVYQKAGVPFYVCPGTSSWVSLTGRWSNAEKNIASAAIGALANGASGLLLTDWGDFGHHQQQVISYPAVCYASGVSWCLEQNRHRDISIPISHVFLGSRDKRWGAYLLETGSLNHYTGMPFRDGSVTGCLLFNQMTNRMIKRLDAFSRTGLMKGFERAKELYNQLSQEEAGTENIRLFQREVLFSIGLFMHSCKLAFQLDEAGTFDVWELSEDTRLALSSEIESYFVEYQSLWLRKNRSGGLKNSLERLFFLKRLYDHKQKRIPAEELATIDI